jgi:hypothetical protein
MERWTLFSMLAALCFPIPSQAGSLTLEIMGGSAYNLPSPLTIHQTGYPDLNLTANFDTKPFGPYLPYYALRASLWEKDQAWEFEILHHRLFLTNPPPEVQNYSIHFGYTYFMAGHAWRNPDFILHLDAGPIITNPENTVRGQKLKTDNQGILDLGYYFSGLGTQVSVSRDLYFWGSAFVVLEVGVAGGWAWDVPVANGSSEVPTLGLHGHLGTGIDL